MAVVMVAVFYLRHVLLNLNLPFKLHDNFLHILRIFTGVSLQDRIDLTAHWWCT